MTINWQQTQRAQASSQGIDIADITRRALASALQAGTQGVQPQASLGGQFYFNPFSAGAPGVTPQGGDIPDIIKAILPDILKAIIQAITGAGHGVKPQFSVGGGISFNPFSSAPAAVTPQSFDIEKILRDLLPIIVPIVLSALSAGPQGLQPQSAGAVAPQSFDLGKALNDVLPIVLPVVLSALSAGPQGLQPQSVGAVAPQGFDLGKALNDVLPIVLPVVLSALSAAPQAMQPQASLGGQFYLNPFSSQPALTTQGVDVGRLIGTLVPVLINMLSSQPQVNGGPNALYH